LERKPKALSGGQRQRVAVGRAIVRKPAVFLFDEPLSNLDAKLRVEMRAELNKLHHRLETTMIYVTHDQVEAMTLGDRIAVMHEGTIQQVAPPLEIYDQPTNKFVAGFIGTPPMNFIRGQIMAENGRLHFDEGTAKLQLPDTMKDALARHSGREVFFGVRPEHLRERSTVPDASPSATLNVTVNVVEQLGDDMLLYLSTAKHDLIAKVDAHQKAAVGQSMQIVVSVAKCHVFDADTGRNITVAPAMARA
jgi:multiple sugar transport system ATP-binding protein